MLTEEMSEGERCGWVAAAAAAAAGSGARSTRHVHRRRFVFVRRQQINVPPGNDSPAERFVDVFVSASREKRAHYIESVVSSGSIMAYDRAAAPLNVRPALARRPAGQPTADCPLCWPMFFVGEGRWQCTADTKQLVAVRRVQ